MNTITPFLWFETQAEEAARYYAAIFPGGKMGEVTRFPAGAIGPEGSVMTASFQIAGNQLVALNGNRKHGFSPATSLHIACASEAEAERVSEQLAAGGARQPGGWLRDKYGVSWQVSARH